MQVRRTNVCRQEFSSHVARSFRRKRESSLLHKFPTATLGDLADLDGSDLFLDNVLAVVLKADVGFCCDACAFESAVGIDRPRVPGARKLIRTIETDAACLLSLTSWTASMASMSAALGSGKVKCARTGTGTPEKHADVVEVTLALDLISQALTSMGVCAAGHRLARRKIVVYVHELGVPGARTINEAREQPAGSAIPRVSSRDRSVA